MIWYDMMLCCVVLLYYIILFESIHIFSVLYLCDIFHDFFFLWFEYCKSCFLDFCMISTFSHTGKKNILLTISLASLKSTNISQISFCRHKLAGNDMFSITVEIMTMNLVLDIDLEVVALVSMTDIELLIKSLIKV